VYNSTVSNSEETLYRTIQVTEQQSSGLLLANVDDCELINELYSNWLSTHSTAYANCIMLSQTSSLFLESV